MLKKSMKSYNGNDNKNDENSKKTRSCKQLNTLILFPCFHSPVA